MVTREHGERELQGRISDPIRVAIVIVTTAAYVLAFFQSYHNLSVGMAGLALLPGMVAGHLLGMRAGLLVGLMVGPLNKLLWGIVGGTGLGFAASTLFYYAIIVLVGGVVGRLRDLHTQVEQQLAGRALAEEALRRSEENLRTFVSNAPVVLWSLNRDGLFTLSEGKGLSALGLQPGEVVGQSVFDVYRGEPQILEDYRRAFSGEPFTSTVELKGVVFESRQSPIHDENGDVVGVIGVATDITGRTMLERMWRRYEFIVNTSKEFMTLINRDYTYEAVNQAYCRAHGKDREAIVGKTAAAIWGAETFNAVIKEHFDACLAGSEAHYEARFEFPAQGLRYMDVTYYPYFNSEGTVTHAVVVSRDITERKQAEEERTRLIEELQEALKAKDEMIQNVSHELRTPLTHIIGYSDLLMFGALDGDPVSDQQHTVHLITEQAEVLNRLVDALLTLQSLTAEEMEWEEVDAKLLVSGAVSAWQERAEKAQVILIPQIASDLPRIRGDFQRLQDALDQLLDNAIKFTGEGSTVSVRAVCHGDELWFGVSDTGIGIPPDRLERVFGRFYQMDASSTRRYGGMGIGLSLVQHIVSLHGGRVWAESEGEGHGTTFYLALPTLSDTDEVEHS